MVVPLSEHAREVLMRRALLGLFLLAGCERPEPPPWSDPPTIQDCYNHRPYSPSAGPIRQAYNEGFLQACIREVAAFTPGMVATECHGAASNMICVTQ